MEQREFSSDTFFRFVLKHENRPHVHALSETRVTVPMFAQNLEVSEFKGKLWRVLLLLAIIFIGVYDYLNIKNKS
jgi:hypothetical protein